MNPPITVGICILAGGLSERMGRDKGRLRLGRRTLLGQVRQTAEGLGLTVRVVRKDLVPRCGPLGGIYTGLKTSKHAAELFLSCDMPFVTRPLLEEIIHGVSDWSDPSYSSDSTSVFVDYRQKVGFPLLLAVDQLAIVEKEIRAGRFSLQNLARRLKARRLRIAGQKARQLFNVNTPADWAEARKRRSELPL